CCGCMPGMKCKNGAGTGLSVTHSSGHTVCVPCVSFDTSNVIFPARFAKSNGCFGYSPMTVTPPPSFTACRSWPLHTITSFGGCTTGVDPSHCASCVENHMLYCCWPKLEPPVLIRDTPH